MTLRIINAGIGYRFFPCHAFNKYRPKNSPCFFLNRLSIWEFVGFNACGDSKLDCLGWWRNVLCTHRTDGDYQWMLYYHTFEITMLKNPCTEGKFLCQLLTIIHHILPFWPLWRCRPNTRTVSVRPNSKTRGSCVTQSQHTHAGLGP